MIESAVCFVCLCDRRVLCLCVGARAACSVYVCLYSVRVFVRAQCTLYSMFLRAQCFVYVALFFKALTFNAHLWLL